MRVVPTIYEIRVALETTLFLALTPSFQAEEIVIIQPGEEIAPDLKKIQVIHSVNPGKVQVGELDLRGGASIRPGVYTIMLSCPNEVDAYIQTTKLTDVIERAFSGKELSAGDGKKVFIDLVDIENPGKLPDNRLGQTISVNWWAWAGEFDDEIEDFEGE